MGLSISNVAATAVANRLIMKSATAGQSILTAASVATGTGTTPGSWVQVTASSAAEYLLSGLLVVQQNNASTSAAVAEVDLPVLIDIGTGGAGSETVMATIPVASTIYDGSHYFMSDRGTLAIPLRIPASTRIAVRAYKNAANQATAISSLVVSLTVTPYLNVEGN